MSLDIFKVDLDTPQPNGRRGESPRSAFTKYNDALDTISQLVTTVSATAPSITVPFMTWADTSTGTIKRRNASNTGWVTEGRLFRSYVPGATFAEVAALTRDEGPIIVHDMRGTAWTWVETPYFTGYRSSMCGELMPGNTVSPRSYQILATGGVWDEANEKDRRVIAHYREQGLVVHIDNWKEGQGMIASLGGGLWKAPDLQDVFLRMAGTDRDTANARMLGEYQADAFQNFVGLLVNRILEGTPGNWTMGSPSGVFAGRGVTESGYRIIGTSAGGPLGREDIIFDPSKVARTSTETRSESVAVAPFIHV